MARAVSFTQASGELNIRSARVVFEPNAYQDDECPRKNIVLEVDEATQETIRVWEADVDPNKLVSALSQYGMRCKLQIDKVRVWSNGGLAQLPSGLRNRHAHAIVRLTGIWHTKKQSGLSLQLTDIEFVTEQDAVCPF